MARVRLVVYSMLAMIAASQRRLLRNSTDQEFRTHHDLPINELCAIDYRESRHPQNNLIFGSSDPYRTVLYRTVIPHGKAGMDDTENKEGCSLFVPPEQCIMVLSFSRRETRRA